MKSINAAFHSAEKFPEIVFQLPVHNFYSADLHEKCSDYFYFAILAKLLTLLQHKAIEGSKQLWQPDSGFLRQLGFLDEAAIP